MILFKKIRYKNILSTGNVFTEIDLDKNSTTLIVGENGAGKSTILDALSFVLFGKPFRKINKPQLLNSITQKQLQVEIEFSIGSNEYKIVRGIKPNIFEVYVNDTLVNQSAKVGDYQDYLEKQILKVNHKSFCQVVVLGSATFQPFMQLSAFQRREIIEDLLDLQIFTTMNSLLKDKVQRNNDQINSISSEKKLIEEKIKLIKEHLAEVQSNNDLLIAEKRSRIAETNAKIEIYEQDLLDCKTKISELELLVVEENTLKNKLNKLSKLKHQIEAKLSVIKKEVDFFENNDECPTCKQSIEHNFKCEAVKKKEADITEIDQGLSMLVSQYEEIDKRVSEIMEINGNINSLRLDIHKINTRMSSAIDYSQNLLDEINSIKDRSVSVEDNKVPELEEQLNAIVQKNVELIEEKNVLSVASILLKDGGIKSRIVKQYIPIINKLINKYLASLEFMCQFELDENFNETIKSRYRDDFSYASFSEGEKMKINLAILFAWRSLSKLRNSINTNLLIMDEVFDSSLDSNGTEEFLKIITNMVSDTNTFIISHKTDQMVDKFEKIIRFEKYKNFSRIKG